MSEYTREIYAMECDYNRNLAPSEILRQALDYMLTDIKNDGCDRSVIYRAFGAVWMIARMRFYQFDHIHAGDTITYHTFPRVIENNKYIYYMEAFRGEEKVLQFDTAFIPVYFKERKIMRLSLLKPYWKTPPREAVSKGLARLKIDCELSDCGSDTVRMSDCDCNHHLTSPCYLSFACDVLDFWGSPEPNLMKMMQVDYSSEVLPGTLLRFKKGVQNGAKIMQGIKPDGKIAFTAKCIF